jgi:leucine-rich repeat-containing protein 49
VHWIESETSTIFVELKQIPNTLIVYRRPQERNANPEKVQIDGRSLKHVPLLEGEERIKHLSLAGNEITKIENIVSMPHLNHLDLSGN